MASVSAGEGRSPSSKGVRGGCRAQHLGALLLTAAEPDDASVTMSAKEFLWIRWGWDGGVMGEFFVLFRNPLGSHNIRGMRLKRLFRKSHCQSTLQKNNLVMKRVFTHGIKEPMAK